MKKGFGPFLQLLFGTLLVAAGIFAGMYLCYLPLRASLGESFTMKEMYFPDNPPENVPPRTIVTTSNLDVLWVKENIDNPHNVYVELFIPNEDSLIFWSPHSESFVFWSPQSESLIALDFATGDVLWETAVPHVGDMGLYNGHFYISSSDWLDRLQSAPKDSDGSFNRCSFAGQVTVVAIDVATGGQTWAYSYWGANDYDLIIGQDEVYLTGSNDHGASRSIVRIDAANGTILERDCYHWPEDEVKELARAPVDESHYSSPYLVISEEDKEKQLSWQSIMLFFVAEENELQVLHGQTQEVVGEVDFEGATLNPWDIDVAVQGNVAVIYFGDSHQLFGFRLPDPNKD